MSYQNRRTIIIYNGYGFFAYRFDRITARFRLITITEAENDYTFIYAIPNTKC